jgi:ABC-type oligopeptide transport system substrate-binding subunit
MRRLIGVVLMVFLAAGAAACSKDSTSDSTPTTPTPATKTETFSGSINQQGQSVHSFSVTTAGSTTVTLTAVDPLTTMALGVAIGTWSNSSCGTTIAYNENARTNIAALSGTATAGSYCLKIYDSGNVPASWLVNYTIQVVHP